MKTITKARIAVTAALTITTAGTIAAPYARAAYKAARILIKDRARRGAVQAIIQGRAVLYGAHITTPAYGGIIIEYMTLNSNFIRQGEPGMGVRIAGTPDKRLDKPHPTPMSVETPPTQGPIKIVWPPAASAAHTHRNGMES